MIAVQDLRDGPRGLPGRAGGRELARRGREPGRRVDLRRVPGAQDHDARPHHLLADPAARHVAAAAALQGARRRRLPRDHHDAVRLRAVEGRAHPGRGNPQDHRELRRHRARDPHFRRRPARAGRGVLDAGEPDQARSRLDDVPALLAVAVGGRFPPLRAGQPGPPVRRGARRLGPRQRHDLRGARRPDVRHGGEPRRDG
jgi:hypothetical protein